MANLSAIRAGNTWFGHLWVIDNPDTGLPRDLTGWDLTLDVRTSESINGAPVWFATSQEVGLRLVDGDGREIEIPCCGKKGKTRILEPVGYPYIVEALQAKPNLAVGEYFHRLTATWDPGDGSSVVFTLDSGRWSVTV